MNYVERNQDVINAIQAEVSLAGHGSRTGTYSAGGNLEDVMLLFDETATGSDVKTALGYVANVDKSYTTVPVISGQVDKRDVGVLKGLHGVKAVEARYTKISLPPIMRKKYTGNIDDEKQPMWNMEKVQAPNCWDRTKDGRGVAVAVIDTGIDYTHPDIKHAFTDCKGYNAVPDGGFSDYPWSFPIMSVNSGDPMDDNGHGTHCAGIIAGAGKIQGVAKKSTLYAVKVLDSTGSGTLESVVEGIEWAINQGVNVMSMSLGTSANIETFNAAVESAIGRGITVVAAAGNSGNSGYEYPASCNGVISVAAVDKNDLAPYWSQKNDKLTLAAPGVEILSCVPGGGYEIMSGTSMACPHVAGSVAVYLSEHDGASPADVRNALCATAKPLGDPFEYGAGLVQAFDAAMT